MIVCDIYDECGVLQTETKLEALPEKRSHLLTVLNAVASHFYALYHDVLSISGIN